MINKKAMMEFVRNQLAIDYNCCPDDFLKDGYIYTEAKQIKGRRPWPWITPRLEMITMGNSIIINATADILPLVQKRLDGKSKYEAMNMPFFYGINPYYLPNTNEIVLIDDNKDFEYKIIEKDEITKIFTLKGMNESIPFSMTAVVVQDDNNIIGMAYATIECEKMCQIYVEVLPDYRGRRIATNAVNKLTIEMLNRGYIPYYSTDCSNVMSQRVAINAGYFPAWSHCFRTRLELL